MGQNLSILNSQFIDLAKLDNNIGVIATTLSIDDKEQEDVNLFLSRKISSDISNNRMVNIEGQLINRIHQHLLRLTDVFELKNTDSKLNETFKEKILPSVITDFEEVIKEINNLLDKKQKLHESFSQNLHKENDASNKHGSSLTSKLSSFISTLVNHVHVSAPERSILDILSKIPNNTVYLKDILCILQQLIFDTDHIYDIRNICNQLNSNFEQVHHIWDEYNPSDSIISEPTSSLKDILSNSLNYLKLINVYPNDKLMKTSKKNFTGQIVACVIFAHIDFHQTIHTQYRFRSGSMKKSISFEFHSQTFKILFDIIQQITTRQMQLNLNEQFIGNICLKLFTTLLKFLSAMTTDHHRNLSQNMETPSIESNDSIHWNRFMNNNELHHWFDTLMILTTDKYELNIRRQASKAIIHLIDIQSISFNDKLTLLHKYILENKNSVLIEQIAIELSTNAMLLSWIQLLVHDFKSVTASPSWIIFNSLLNIYFNSSIMIISKMSIEKIFERFQQLVFVQLIGKYQNKYIIANDDHGIDLLAVQYIEQIFNQELVVNDLFKSILLGLGVMAKIECSAIQPIFIAVLPLLVEFVLKNMNQKEDHVQYMYWLLGQMINTLIMGPPNDPFEMKHIDKLKSPLFAGGCEKINQSNLFESNMAVYCQLPVINFHEETSFDQEFLMSIYNNTDQGGRLISKMRLSIKDKQCILQKSIEKQANNACAHLFAVYIKHYRRINLAKDELNREDNIKPHKSLLSIFNHANRIRTIFATTRGQGGDCQQLYEQIRMKCLFLLQSVKANHLIPIIKSSKYEESSMISTKLDKNLIFEQNCLQKRIGKESLRLLRDTFQACLRLKTFMLNKKKMLEDNQNIEDILHRTIANYVYGNRSNNDIQSEMNELLRAMSCQNERAMLRLITYRFMYTFIQKLGQIEQKTNVKLLSALCLPYLRTGDVQWSYLENISAANVQWKDEIGRIYYSIVETILSMKINEPMIVFHLLNLSYTSTDIQHLHQRLFIPFIRPLNVSFREDFIAFNWFRLYLLQLCENFLTNDSQKIFDQQLVFIFHQLIFNELKELSSNDIELIESQKNSFRIATFNIELGINQWLMLLLRCIQSYEHVRILCATADYVNELIHIYRHSKNLTTTLLSLKIIRKLLLNLPDKQDGISKTIVTNLLDDILRTIGDSLRSHQITVDVITELIYIYRAMLSFQSPWQSMATQMIINIITTASIDNNLLAVLSILGGYIHPFCLGSIVQVYDNDQSNNEPQMAVILEIDRSYLVQYCENNQTNSVTGDQLRIELDVFPPNLLDLPITNETIGKLFDVLISFVEMDESVMDSLLVLQVKRRSIGVLYRLLMNKKLLEIFMTNSNASCIARLSASALSTTHRLQPTDLCLWNKRHLEQYCLSLDRCEYLKQIIDDINVKRENETPVPIWNRFRFKTDREYIADGHQWKPMGSKDDIEKFKQGWAGNDDIRIVPMPPQLTGQWIIEECGISHQFPGRVCLISETGNASLATFIIDQLHLTKGNWYFCVRLLESHFAQIGWATTGFNPSEIIGIGNDTYSWSYDGSQGMLYNREQASFPTSNVRWNMNDVCGCGIEIDGVNTRIRYWLNGHLLGTAFSHQNSIGLTEISCDMLPNGVDTSFFPGVSLKVNDASMLSSCEFIFSPEDMYECPLPNGYKPLLLPILVKTVTYPSSAYLISDSVQDNIYRKRNDDSTTFLRDFVNDNHLETEYIIDNHHLVLPKDSQGFLLTMNDNSSSWTISFHFQLDKISHDDIPLITSETFSISIPSSKITDKTQAAITFDADSQQTKVYINNEYRIFNSPVIAQSNIYLLPTLSGKIQKLAVWNYALLDEQIRRLFNFGLSYVVTDYHRLKEYRMQANTLTFTSNQKDFIDEFLVPVYQPTEAEKNEWNYFKSIDGTDYSTIQLFGNQTYLMLDKSTKLWLDYTLILDVSIVHLPIVNEQLTFVTLNSQTNICLTNDGYICLIVDGILKMKSKSTGKLNQYVRLLISVHEQCLKIYIDGVLELDISVDNDQLMIKDKYIKLFCEDHSTKNTVDDNTIRIECRSITYMNWFIDNIAEQMKSVDYSLENVVAPPYSIMSPSLICIGHDESLIKTIMKENLVKNCQSIDRIIREQQEAPLKAMMAEKLRRQRDLIGKVSPSIDREKVQNLLQISEFDTDEKIIALGEILFDRWNDIQSSNPLPDTDINFAEWFQDISTVSAEEVDPTYQLLDLNRSIQEQTTLTDRVEEQRKKIQKSSEYNHQQISHQQFNDSRIACEHGLISMYAHYTILTMLKVWSTDGSCLFPLEKFGDSTFIITLLKLLDYHYNYTRLHTDETIDRMSLLITSILKVETNELLKHQESTSREILENKAPLLYQLQKNFIIQSIQFLADQSLLLYDYDDESTMIDKQSLIRKPNLNFILKVINLFVKLLTDQSTMSQEEIDILVPLLFPASLINQLFNLFILSPMQQSKIIIIHLFSTLIQKSKYFNLSERIQHFLYQLLIELPPNSTSMNSRTTKTFQIAIADLIYLLDERHRHQNLLIKTDFSQFSRHDNNLLTFIDVLNALTDKSKRTLFPEAFILQFTRDELEQSHYHFDTTADLQLVDFINRHALTNESFVELINSLPTDVSQNPTYYKAYPSLWHIPTTCIQTRIKFVWQLNILVENVISNVDFNLLPGESILTDKVRTVRPYVLYKTKLPLFNTTLIMTELPSQGDMITVNFDTVRASIKDDHGLNTMFNQAYEQLYDKAQVLFRRQDERLWKAQYLGMHSTDQGGPYRDSITCICSDICSERLPLFILCPNGRTNSGSNCDRWIPNVYSPDKLIPNRTKNQYRFVGQLMGMAIRKKNYLDLKFPMLLWKQLVREQITSEDIEAIDIQSFTMINEMEKTMPENDQSIDLDDVLSSILDELRFEVVSSKGSTFELVPNGQEIPVTIANFKEYCASYRNYRLNEFHRQIEFIRQGLYSIIPGYFLSLFTGSELEEAVCGKGEIDVELLKRNTNYGSAYSPDAPCIQRFWIVLGSMFTEEQKKLFLKFVWGRCTLPNSDEDFTTRFTINGFDITNGPVDGALPRSHTCSFALDLPEYSSTDVMYDRLNYAITYCSSIDGDGNMNEMPDPASFTND
ncbi:unnamed protein product [Adineta steineri]|uniref:Uncharacterized protein n=1 Tax=Adineta steineri TaxID=433720 RepID=A0A813UCZ2_9BILA|nr:unnamed protein product [Adineta steineri]CAF3727689.1 unnamed protein product [Adineta steineri]